MRNVKVVGTVEIEIYLDDGVMYLEILSLRNISTMAIYAHIHTFQQSHDPSHLL